MKNARLIGCILLFGTVFAAAFRYYAISFPSDGFWDLAMFGSLFGLLADMVFVVIFALGNWLDCILQEFKLRRQKNKA